MSLRAASSEFMVAPGLVRWVNTFSTELGTTVEEVYTAQLSPFCTHDHVLGTFTPSSTPPPTRSPSSFATGASSTTCCRTSPTHTPAACTGISWHFQRTSAHPLPCVFVSYQCRSFAAASHTPVPPSACMATQPPPPPSCERISKRVQLLTYTPPPCWLEQAPVTAAVHRQSGHPPRPRAQLSAANEQREEAGGADAGTTAHARARTLTTRARTGRT